MHIDDGRLVRAHQKVAAGKLKRFTSPLAHSCERLRRVRDERRNARPDRCRDRIERCVDTGTARQTDGDRGQMPCPSHPKIGNKHPAANRSQWLFEGKSGEERRSPSKAMLRRRMISKTYLPKRRKRSARSTSWSTTPEFTTSNLLKK